MGQMDQMDRGGMDRRTRGQESVTSNCIMHGEVTWVMDSLEYLGSNTLLLSIYWFGGCYIGGRVVHS